MNDSQCGSIRELIPDFVAGRLPAVPVTHVERHIVECRECRAEVELARRIFMSRPQAPAELFQRAVRAARGSLKPARRPWWGASAAGIAALALGIGIVSGRSSDLTIEVPGYAQEVDEGELWVSDDGLLAGAPSFDGLTDEALAQLLDELTVGAAGGAA